MKLVWSPTANRKRTQQIDYLIERNAPAAARALNTRIENFIHKTLLLFPGHGRSVLDLDIRETGIPKTRMVLWYRFDDEVLEIVDLWHSSQDRDKD